MTGISAKDPRIDEIITSQKDKPGALLPLLHAIQDLVGYIPSDCVPAIADALNLSRAEVHGVISFYHYFRDTPPGRTIVQICRAESCQAMGSKTLEEYAKGKLGIDYHETTQDGAFSLEPVYCLGLCACSPSVQVGDEVYGRVTPDILDRALLEVEVTA